MDDNAPALILPSQPANLLPIPSVKVYRTRDGNVAEKLRYDMSGFTMNQIRTVLVALTVDQIQQQISIDNPPAFADVDGVRGKGIVDAQRRVVVSFGMRLKMQALIDLKSALKTAIERSTITRTGMLSDMSNWEYRYVRGGKVTPLPITGASGIPMGPNDFIVLMPKGVRNKKGGAYATAANMRVAGSGKLSFRRTATGKPKAKDQSIGYLALTARAAKSTAAFGGFNVTANFTTAYHVLGEVTHRGGNRTGYLKISPKTGSRGR